MGFFFFQDFFKCVSSLFQFVSIYFQDSIEFVQVFYLNLKLKIQRIFANGTALFSTLWPYIWSTCIHTLYKFHQYVWIHFINMYGYAYYLTTIKWNKFTKNWRGKNVSTKKTQAKAGKLIHVSIEEKKTKQKIVKHNKSNQKNKKSSTFFCCFLLLDVFLIILNFVINNFIPFFFNWF